MFLFAREAHRVIDLLVQPLLCDNCSLSGFYNIAINFVISDYHVPFPFNFTISLYHYICHVNVFSNYVDSITDLLHSLNNHDISLIAITI